MEYSPNLIRAQYQAVISRPSKRAARTFLNTLLIISQWATRPFIFFFGLILRIHVEQPDPFLIPPGTLILANHQSYLDPFLIAFYLGYKNWLHLLPIRFPVKSSVIRNPWVALPIRALGGYNIGSTPIERARKLLLTRELIETRRTVILFPEGTITSNGEMIGDFKMGAQTLFSTGCPIVCVRLKGFTKQAFVKSFLTNGFSIAYSELILGTPERKLAAMTGFFKQQ